MNTLKSLQYLASKKDDFETPSEGASNIDTDLTPKSKPKTYEDEDASDLISKVASRLSGIKTDFDDFDDCIDSIDEYDEDTELKNSILAIGRKYARENTASGEMSEIVQAFAPQESKLNGLVNMINRDITAIEEDLREMRMGRTRNYRYITDLTDAKSTLYNNQTAVIKELNQLKKTQFELKQKQKAAEAGVGDNSMAAQAVIQSMFGMGHDTLLSSVGGRAGSSGSYEEDYSDYDEYEAATSSAVDNVREAVVDASDNDDGSDGAKFLKYENLGVEYVLEEDDEGHTNVYAEDKNGNRVDDYPLPTDISTLSFERNERGGYATDQFSRRYKLRHI